MTNTDLCDSVLNDLFVRHITLVAYKQLVDTLCSISVNLLKPLLNIVEGIHISDIVDNANAVSASIVGGCDGSETFLSSGIPLQISLLASAQVCLNEAIPYDLQLHSLAIQLDCSDFLPRHQHQPPSATQDPNSQSQHQ